MPPRKPATRKWSSLGSASQRRYERAAVKLGIPDVVKHYESGGSLRALRGHAKTPEKPKEAERSPEKYREYLARVPDRSKPIRVRTVSGDRWVFGMSASERRTVSKHAALLAGFQSGKISETEFRMRYAELPSAQFYVYSGMSPIRRRAELSTLTLANNPKQVVARDLRSGKKYNPYADDDGKVA